jgi:hypothetical protein
LTVSMTYSTEYYSCCLKLFSVCLLTQLGFIQKLNCKTTADQALFCAHNFVCGSKQSNSKNMLTFNQFNTSLSSPYDQEGPAATPAYLIIV